MLCHLPSAWADSGGPGQDEGALLTRLSCADMEVLYWRHVREQLETLRKLQRREASTGHRLDPTRPLVGEAVPLRCSLCAGG